MSFWQLTLTLLSLASLILLHELGHYWAARRCHMQVQEFSIGFGWPLLSWRARGVVWNIRCLPFGGFVRIAGMDDESRRSSEPGTYFASRLIDRAKVVLAGPLANFAAAFVFFCAIDAFGGRRLPLSQLTDVVGWVQKDSSWERAGLRPGDLWLEPLAKVRKSTGPLGESARIQRTDFATGRQEALVIEGVDVERAFSSGQIAPAQMLYFRAAQASNSPIAKVDLMPGDRFIWGDGERLFSAAQLSSSVNDTSALVTFERNGARLHRRVPKFEIRQLKSAGEEDIGDFWSSWITGIREVDEGTVHCLPLEMTADNAVIRPIALAGLPPVDLLPGDRIAAIDGCPASNPSQVAKLLQTKHVALIIQRSPGARPLRFENQEVLSRELYQPFSSPDLQALLAKLGSGVQISAGEFTLLPPIEAPAKPGANFPFLKAGRSEQNWRSLGGLFADRQILISVRPLAAFWGSFTAPIDYLVGLVTARRSLDQLSGPVGIMGTIYSGWSLGLSEVLLLLAHISISLGVLNLLPIPPLDGGQLAFIAWEKALGRPLSPVLMSRIALGFALSFAALTLFICYQDVQKLLGWQ